MSVHIAAICGSMRGDNSYTRLALELTLASALNAGATVDRLVEIIDEDV